MVRLFLAILIFTSPIFSEEYLFRGKHFIASYLDCDLRALTDLEELLAQMENAIKASDATLLDKVSYVFPPNGLTAVFLLSESHVSIHTYPEHGACFIDLFTCGDHCSAFGFHELMMAYLKPKNVSTKLFLRDSTAQELPFP
jgi:S-adenosylmethionine decarboxylase